jgi:hypothetical protein
MSIGAHLRQIGQGAATSSPALAGELHEFNIEQLWFGIRPHAGQIQEQSKGYTKFYPIAQVRLQRFLFQSRRQGSVLVPVAPAFTRGLGSKQMPA